MRLIFRLGTIGFRGVCLKTSCQRAMQFHSRTSLHRGPCGANSSHGLRATSNVSSGAPATQQQALKQRQAAGSEQRQIAKFCSECGGAIKLQIPAGEREIRHVCIACDAITYYNPKMVVGVICEHDGKILLCKRAIEPCKGLWTLPAGFMEMNESTAEGARRETLEEAGAEVEITAPYAHFDIPRIGQAYILFRAKLLPPFKYGPSDESLETILVSPEEISSYQLAFSSISLALTFYAEEAKSRQFKLHHGVVEKREGSAPNDPSAYRLRDHREYVLNNV